MVIAKMFPIRPTTRYLVSSNMITVTTVLVSISKVMLICSLFIPLQKLIHQLKGKPEMSLANCTVAPSKFRIAAFIITMSLIIVYFVQCQPPTSRRYC